jgi:filamentous hemagglutinin family protein
MMGQRSWTVFLGVASVVIPSSAIAQVIPDQSIGTIVTPDGNTYEIKGGTTVGGRNLFHSFEQFDVRMQEIADFRNDPSIVNIFSRVTGEKGSEINGILRSQGRASLFLINPNGIIFGQSAQLQIGGSFVTTTANALQFANGAEFSSTSSVDPNNSLLAVDPSAFLFNQINPAPIQNRSTAGAGRDPSNSFNVFGLRVPDGHSLLMLGGNIDTNGGGIVAFSGRVEIGAVAGQGAIGLTADNQSLRLSFPAELPRANIFHQNRAGLIVAGNEGGSITLTGNNIFFRSRSSLDAGVGSNLGNERAQAEDITLNATDTIQLEDGVEISNAIFSNGKGNAGNTNITARQLIVRDSNIVNTVYGQGKAGDLNVQVSDSIDLSGEITNLDGSIRSPGGLLAQLEPMGSGQAGKLTIQTRQLRMSDGSKVQVATFGKGDAGNLTIRAKEIDVLETARPNFFTTTISADVGTDPRFINASEGTGGSVSIEADRITLRNGGRIGAATNGRGKAGNVFITANQLLEVIGTIVDVEPSNQSAQPSSRIVAVVDIDATGKGGNLTIRAGQLSVRDGGRISASTLGQGDAGAISITVDRLAEVIGISKDNRFTSEIRAVAGSESVGAGGSIEVKAGNLIVINQGTITARSESIGRAGDIKLTVTEKLQAERGEILTSSNQSGGGNITVNAGKVFLRNNSNIRTNSSSADGGNITFTADTIVALEDSNILAYAPEGQGGDIFFNTRAFLSNPLYRPPSPLTDRTALDALLNDDKSDVNASGTVPGTIVGVPDITFLQNSLTQLPQNAINTNSLLANSCITRNQQQGGNFFITGSGGLSVRPGDAPSSIYPTGTVRSTPNQSSSSESQRPWKIGDAIVEPQGAYQLPDGKTVLSRDCQP